MRGSSILSCTLVLGLAAATATITTTCNAYPAIQSRLADCKSASDYCVQVLGRHGTTTTTSVKRYTETVSNTATLTELYNATSTASITLPFYTSYSTFTVLECSTQPAPPEITGHVNVKPGAVVPEAAGSCGVAKYSSAYVSSACSCVIDETVVEAHKVVTKTTGVSYAQITTTATSHTTYTSYLATTSGTTTRYDANCSPPPSAACNLNTAINCTIEDFYESWQCGSDPSAGYSCECGYDSHDQPNCWNSENFSCLTAPTCTYDYDCADGYFCVYANYDQDFNCCVGGHCALADVCLNDQPTSTSASASATPS